LPMLLWRQTVEQTRSSRGRQSSTQFFDDLRVAAGEFRGKC
jgi:hypothetical protein